MVRKKKHDARFYPAVAYVAALREDVALYEAALARAKLLQPRGWGKPFTVNARIGFRIHSLLSGWGVTAPPEDTPTVVEEPQPTAES